MNEGMDQAKEVFRSEALELLNELETALLELEDTHDHEAVNSVFRAMHTIKGASGMFGYDDIASLTHELETVFDLVRNNKTRVSKELIDLTLAARDNIFEMLDADEETNEDVLNRDLLEAIRRMIPAIRDVTDEADPEGATSNAKGARSIYKGRDVTYWVRFSPDLDILRDGTNPLNLMRELCNLGTCKVIAHTEAIPELSAYDPETCYISWDAIVTTDKGINAIKDIFVFLEGRCGLRIKVIDDSGGIGEGEHKKLGEILIENGVLTEDDLIKVLKRQKSRKRIGEILVDEGITDRSTVESALLEQQLVKEMRIKRQTANEMMNVRVSSEKLDSLVDLVGELVTVQARLSQYADDREMPELVSIAEEVERLTENLRDKTMSIRMLPIGSTFSKFRRLVRDLSNELGKDVMLATEGAETELDKTVIERLNDPLVHLIRNCIYHGIETPEVREKSGKTGKGMIHLSAEHSGGHVLIHVSDDGAGIDIEAVKRRAVSRGLIESEADINDKEALSLIFAPGFSTVKTVTDVSGRGVGMDVVKKEIESLRGDVEIMSTKGKGTTITLKLPLTLAIIDGLLVKIDDGLYVLPLSLVEECVELSADDIAHAHGRHMADVRGEIVPYIRLRELFHSNGNKPGLEQIVITRTSNRRVGFVVDYVIGEHQTVIKSLGRVFRNVDGISGATILGDGTVALILDVQKLILYAELDEVGTIGNVVQVPEEDING
jgi:two-component system chemotaxis sensor kinase CheA